MSRVLMFTVSMALNVVIYTLHFASRRTSGKYVNAVTVLRSAEVASPGAPSEVPPAMEIPPSESEPGIEFQGPDQVELPWKLVRPLVGILPFDADGTTSAKLRTSLGLTPAQAGQLSRIGRAAVASQAEKTTGLAQCQLLPDGSLAVSLPPIENDSVDRILAEIELLGLPQYEIIKEIINDDRRTNTEINDRQLVITAGANGEFSISERQSRDGVVYGSTVAHYRNLTSVPADYAALIRKFMHQQ